MRPPLDITFVFLVPAIAVGHPRGLVPTLKLRALNNQILPDCNQVNRAVTGASQWNEFPSLDQTHSAGPTEKTRFLGEVYRHSVVNPSEGEAL